MAIRERPQALNEVFNRHASGLCMSTITLAELCLAAEQSSDPEHNLQVVYAFAGRMTVLDFDIPAASHAGEIRSHQSAGRMDLHDLYVAAHARSKGVVLLTPEPDVYATVSGLRIEKLNSSNTQECAK